MKYTKYQYEKLNKKQENNFYFINYGHYYGRGFDFLKCLWG